MDARSCADAQACSARVPTTAKPSGGSDAEGIWGAYNYDSGKDVLRAEMTLSEAPFSFDQLTFSFVNMSQSGGTLAVMWEKELATIDFMAH